MQPDSGRAANVTATAPTYGDSPYDLRIHAIPIIATYDHPWHLSREPTARFPHLLLRRHEQGCLHAERTNYRSMARGSGKPNMATPKHVSRQDRYVPSLPSAIHERVLIEHQRSFPDHDDTNNIPRPSFSIHCAPATHSAVSTQHQPPDPC